MTKNKLAAFTAALALVAFLSTGCTETTTNTATNTSNTAVAVNNNGNANRAGVSNANTTANSNSRKYNANITKEEYEKDKDRYGTEAKGLGDKVGTGITDGYYWVKVRGALALVDDLRDSTINVDVDNAMVTLRGTVASEAQKTKAAQAAKVDGVKSVKNELKVAAAGGDANKNAGNKNATANTANKPK
jgi:hypothetical protein